ncbi:MAG: PHP domain-containing protein [Clostridiales bacterium]|nr:PHP domain-containing protein [Clostridiales bacterium]
MNTWLLRFDISPRVVLADREQAVTVKSLDSSYPFFDRVEYLVTVIRTDGWKYVKGKELTAGGRDLFTEYKIHPKDGVITFTHNFTGEGEWEIKINYAEDQKPLVERSVNRWSVGKNRWINGFSFRMYSLKSDLYSKRPYKGDLHVHTIESDGYESPQFVAAQYRKYGYDFIAITDHYYMQSSVDAVNALKDIDSGLKIFAGEEVHPIAAGGIFHVVNFNGKKSVNELYNSNPEKAKAEIENIAKSIDEIDQTDRLELAYFKWIFDKIRDGGGIAIYPHAFWQVGYGYHVRPYISDKIIRGKMCDAYEVFGGMSKRDNREMAEYAAELRADGIDLPMVASSDSHSTRAHGYLHFDDVWTMVFAKDKEDIPSAILNGDTVVVDNFNESDKIAHGKLRLVKYANFLIEQYYEFHDELCSATGQALIRYVLNDKSQKDLVERLDNERKVFDEKFFGK